MAKKKKKHKSKKVAKPAPKKQGVLANDEQNQSAKKPGKNAKKQKKQTAVKPKKEKKPRKFKQSILKIFKFKEETQITEETKPKEAVGVSAATSAKRKLFLYNLRKPIIIVFSLLAVAFVFFVASLLITLELANKSMPGTRVAGMDVSLLTVDEIQNRLMEKGKPFLESQIPVTMEGITAQFTPAELGVSLDPRHTLQDINFIRFGKTNVINVINGLIVPNNISYYVSIDLDAAIKNIELKFNFDEKKSSNAYLTFENDALTIVPEKAGKAIDMRTLYLNIKENANKLSSGQIQVALLDDTPLVTKQILETELEGIKETLKKKTYLEYDNFTYTVKLIDHLDWVKFNYKDELKIGEKYSLPIETSAALAGSANLNPPFSIQRKLWINIVEGPFDAWVNEGIVADIESEPQDVEISKNENGEIIFNGRGENGRKIIKSFLISGLEEAVNNNVEDLVIPVAEKKAQVKTSDELQEMGIKTLIATGRSAFAGSTVNRIHNINVGVNKFNGLLIEPGETFSFNDHLGPVEAYTGFKPELVIKAEGTIPEYGGGLCQVSSTMYRAALFAGFPIVERAPHSYAVSYYAQIYGYGLDATIYPGVHDLKFVNDSPGYVLIQSYTDGVKAFYKFYGTDDGRKVEMEGPYTYGYHSPGPAQTVESASMAPGARKQVEIAHTGFNALWYRYITKNGATVKERLESAYRAIPAKIMVGPSAAPAE